jgi:hypothetical protein
VLNATIRQHLHWLNNFVGVCSAGVKEELDSKQHCDQKIVMMKLRYLSLVFSCGLAIAETPSAKDAQQKLIQSIAAGEDAIGSIPFGDVLKATTGKAILPFNMGNDAVAKRIAAAVGNALQTALEEANKQGNQSLV